MKLVVFVISLWIALVTVVFSDYSGSPGATAERLAVGAAERQITLDSTVIGISTLISGLEVPWEIAWGPDSCIWFTEQNGLVSKVNPSTGKKSVLLKIKDIYRKRLGLLSMAIHPHFNSAPYVFFNYLHLVDSTVYSKLVRYTYKGELLENPKILLDFPAYIGHNGSRVTIAPDGKIMLATGDGQHAEDAQDSSLLKGKVLRLNIDGSIPPDNPVKGSPVWASGFRVPQGMTYDAEGNLFTSEHGDATDDEVNLVEKGRNYGWPTVQGFVDLPEEKSFTKNKAITEPLRAWTPTIAPAGIAYYNANSIPEWKNSILLTTLKTQTLRVLKLHGDRPVIESEKIFFPEEYGRLRAVCVSPGGDVYISTSNRDWNPPEGFPVGGDDRIIRIFKVKALKSPPIASSKKRDPLVPAKKVSISKGQLLYNNYCASCHKKDGTGVPGTFPPLKNTRQVVGNKTELVRILLNGLNEPIIVNGKRYDQPMPRFDFLSNEEIAEVGSYIRTSFGNKAGGISAGEVGKIRAVVK